MPVQGPESPGELGGDGQAAVAPEALRGVGGERVLLAHLLQGGGRLASHADDALEMGDSNYQRCDKG